MLKECGFTILNTQQCCLPTFETQMHVAKLSLETYTDFYFRTCENQKIIRVFSTKAEKFGKQHLISYKQYVPLKKICSCINVRFATGLSGHGQIHSNVYERQNT